MSTLGPEFKGEQGLLVREAAAGAAWDPGVEGSLRVSGRLRSHGPSHMQSIHPSTTASLAGISCGSSGFLTLWHS